MIERGYATLPDRARQVHFRRAGTGPPVVLVHASPGSSLALEPLLLALSQRGRTAIALDSAGFGQSDPLPHDQQPSAGDYASVLGDALDALGLRQFDLYGTHTGAKIALELALARPLFVRFLLLDGIGLYTPEEQARQLAHYAPSLAPTWDGTHLVRAWSLRRDMALFWPWYDQTPSARRFVGVPPADVLHSQVVDILRGGDHYRGGYYAAFSHDTRAALPRLTVPTLIVFRGSDVITDHAQRLPALPPGVSVEVVPASGAETQHIAERLLQRRDLGPLDNAPPAAGQASLRTPLLTRAYVRTAAGVVHVRRGGAGPRRAVVLLHGSPRSSASLAALASALSEDRPVVAIDTPGYGDSDAPTWPEPDQSLTPFAAVIGEVIRALTDGPVDVFGTHTGAALALELAIAAPELIHSVVLHGLPVFDDAERADLLEHYFPRLEPVWDGSHLLTAWHLCRNLLLFWPWYRQEPEATLRYPLVPEALHRDVLDLLKAGPSYAWAYRAAFLLNTHVVLPRLQVAALLATTPGDPLQSHAARAQALRPDLAMVEVPSPSSPDQRTSAAIYRTFFQR
ncbi:MAG TPA: alpha/beta hydrolase [Chloroflexota bacterium]